MTPKLKVEWDALFKRYRATCTVCGWQGVRAKREAVEHLGSQHLAYEHGIEHGIEPSP